MSKTLSFKQLAKMIHPDTNPAIENASEKMMEATKYMDDEQTLYRLAVNWQLIDDDLSKFDIKYKINEGKHLLKDQESCIVLDTYWDKSGKLTVILYNKDRGGKYEKFQRVDEYDQNEDFFVNGIYMEDDYADIDYNYQMIKWRKGGI